MIAKATTSREEALPWRWGIARKIEGNDQNPDIARHAFSLDSRSSRHLERSKLTNVYSECISRIHRGVGTVAGQWDVYSGRLGKDLREIRLPGIPQNMTLLFVEFGYIVSSSVTMHGHDSTEHVLLNQEPFQITRV